MNAPRHRECQRGVAAVELALVLFSASLLLAALLFCARLGWQAIALHRAMYSAALVMADASPEAMLDAASTAQVAQNARETAAELLQGAGIGTPINPLAIGIQCDGSGCGSTVQPQSLTFYALMPVTVGGVGDGLVFYMLGATSMDIVANETVPYAP
jgi:hypothetical protein